MKGGATAALSLVLCSSYAGALIPGAKFLLDERRQAMAVRRRVGERVSPSSVEERGVGAGDSSSSTPPAAAAAGIGRLQTCSLNIREHKAVDKGQDITCNDTSTE